MFKKFFVLIAALLFSLILTGCNEEVGELTNAEELLVQSIEVMEQLDSYSMNLEGVQETTINENGKIKLNIKMQTDATVNPLAFYQKLSMESDMDMVGSYETEMYLVDEMLYMYEPFTKEWIEMSLSDTEELGGLAEIQLSPNEQLSVLRSFTDKIEVEEKNDQYVLMLNGKGTEFKEVIEQVASVGTDGLDQMLTMFTQFDINNLEYEIFIDKQTLQQTSFNMLMDITMGIEGETIRTVQTMSAKITDYNNIDEITLPEGL